MNISRTFIERPVATSVLFVSILFFGWLGFNTLPVNDLPNVDFPTITVTARLPGASPEIMANTVALPLEREFSRISGIDEMTSSSTSGNTRITLTFSLKRDIDSAAQDVQTAISQAIRRLPGDMPEPPTLRKLNPADAPVLILAVAAKDTRRCRSWTSLPMPTSRSASRPSTAWRRCRCSAPRNTQCACLSTPTRFPSGGWDWTRWSARFRAANSNLPSGSLQGKARTYTVKSDGKLEKADGFQFR